MSNAIGTNRFVMLLFAVVASLALTLSGCGATSGDSGHGHKPAIPAGQNPKYFGHMEVGEDTEGNVPDGRTLQGPNQAPFGSYSYGNRARPIDIKHDETEYSKCIPQDALFDQRWASNISTLESAGYTVDAVCELSIDMVESEIAYGSDLFADVDVSNDDVNVSLGGTMYDAFDTEGMVVKVFVPSDELVDEYGSKGVFTADYLFYHQKNDGENGELYRNLTADEAHAIFNSDG